MWFGSETGNESSAGGYLNNTTGQVDSPSKKDTVRRTQNVVPVVIRQIRDSGEDDFKLFSLTPQIVCIVGILRDYEVQTTKAIYNIEDHTGDIKAIWWLENDADTNLPPVKEGSYIQVFGSLRSQDGVKMLMVLRMFLVEDANVVTNHLLQVIHARLAAEAMAKSSVIQIKANNPGAALANSMSFMDTNIVDNGQLGLTSMQQKVFRLLQTDNTQAGMNRESVLKQFPPNQHREVNNAVDFLINEGHAYSTIDNDHFKVTDTM